MAENLKVTEIKEILKQLALPTYGSKTELIKRLLEADPSGERWGACAADATFSTEANNQGQDQEEASISAASGQTTRMVLTEEQRKARADTLEITMLRREIELMRREIENLRSSPISEEERIIPNRTAQPSIRTIGELLSDFDGPNTDFREWEHQIRLLCQTYRLDDNTAKMLVASKLKGHARRWLHSRAEYIQLGIDELLREMRTVFDSRPNRVERRRQFEKRKWMADETFGQYYYEKLILANQVPIDTDELVDYLIDGIPDEQLRNQARIQNFETSGKLLEAFRKVTLRPNRTSSWNVRKDIRGEARKTSVTKEETNKRGNERDSPKSQGKRCFNCQKQGHLSVDCPQARKEKRGCFACGETGHLQRDCPDKKSEARDKKSDNEHRQIVNYVVKKDEHCQSLNLDTQLDTGSPVSFIKASVIPEKFIVKCQGATNKYEGLNESELSVKGTGKFDVELSGRKQTDIPILLVPDGTMKVPAVLGRDILSKFGCKLTMPGESVSKFQNQESEEEKSEVLHINVHEQIKEEDKLNINPDVPFSVKERFILLFLREYENAQRPDEPETKMKLKLELTNLEPFYFNPRRLSFEEKNKLTEILDDLSERGIIRSSESKYASPIVLVRKRDGRLRLCVDYRILNARTARENYPLPLIEDQLDTLRGKKYYSLMDLRDGFHQIEMEEESIQYTAFITPLGHFEYRRMPFGLKSAPSRFQRFVNTALSELLRSGDVTVYMDDILISTMTLDEHFVALKKVFKKLVQNRLELKLEKCKFMFTEIRYLGYMVSEEGVRPTEDGVDAVRKFPVPRNKHEVQRFIGLCAYFRKFIEGFSTTAKPLYQLMKKDAEFKFEGKEVEAFEMLKKKLMNAPILAIYDPRRETELHCDASAAGFGAVVLQRLQDKKLHPVFYFSKRATDAESRYHSFELETLAIIYALRRFRTYLQGIKFKIVTDCNALNLTLKKKEIHPRIARWALELQDYDYTMEHRPGSRMQHVDALSRVGSILLIEGTSSDFDLAVKQSRDPAIKNIAERLEKTEDKLFELRNGLIYRKQGKDLLFWVPAEMEKNVIFRYHDQMGHFGPEKTSATILLSYWFPKLRQKVRMHIDNCLTCVSFNPPAGKLNYSLHNIPKGNAPFEIIHVDHFGPVDKETSKKYILLIIDGFTKHVKLYATKSTSSREVVTALQSYFAYYSKPKILVSDRGTAFTSEEFEEFLKSCEVKHVKIATGSPQANGQVERINRIIKPMLGKLSDENQKGNWTHVLGDIEFALNNTVSRSTGETASRLLFGTEQRGKLIDRLKELLSEEKSERPDIKRIRESAVAKIEAVQRENAKRYSTARGKKNLYEVGDLVMIRNFGTSTGRTSKTIAQYKGPYEVTKVFKNDRYLVSDPEGFQNTQRRYQGVWEAKNMRSYNTNSKTKE